MPQRPCRHGFAGRQHQLTVLTVATRNPTVWTAAKTTGERRAHSILVKGPPLAIDSRLPLPGACRLSPPTLGVRSPKSQASCNGGTRAVGIQLNAAMVTADREY